MADQEHLIFRGTQEELEMRSGKELDRAEDLGFQTFRIPVQLSLKPDPACWSKAQGPVYLIFPCGPCLEFSVKPDFVIPKEGMIGDIVSNYGQIIGEARITPADLHAFTQEKTELPSVTVPIVPLSDNRFRACYDSRI